jgi:hypothetical protein
MGGCDLEMCILFHELSSAMPPTPGCSALPLAQSNR